jgi:hypothetical protein
MFGVQWRITLDVVGLTAFSHDFKQVRGKGPVLWL